jgi:adenylylsulfate kinase-like enzyme
MDRGEIDDLIGYSNINPYDEPQDPSVVIETGNNTPLDDSKKQLFQYMKYFVIKQ